MLDATEARAEDGHGHHCLGDTREGFQEAGFLLCPEGRAAYSCTDALGSRGAGDGQGSEGNEAERGLERLDLEDLCLNLMLRSWVHPTSSCLFCKCEIYKYILIEAWGKHFKAHI